MPRNGCITEDLLERIKKVDKIVSEWMHNKNLCDIDTEGCMETLVSKGIYKYDSKGKAHHFREDLRTLRDCRKIDIFENIEITQKMEGARWYIRLVRQYCGEGMVHMLIAEKKSKLNLVDVENRESNLPDTDLSYITRMEDILASNVFGVIKDIDVKVLNAILVEAGIDELTEKFRFEFWSKYDDGTEPDIIIKTQSRYILIEVQYLSDFDKGTNDKPPQIIREIEGSKEELGNRKFDYLAITKEEEIDWNLKVFFTDEYVKKLKANSQYLHHISQNKMYEILKEINENDVLDYVSENFLMDLIDYLEKKEIGYSKINNVGNRLFAHFIGKESQV